MTRVLNSIDAATAQRIRDAIAGKPQLREAKPKRAESVKATVSQFHKFDPQTNRHTVQLPIVFRTAEYNAGRTPKFLKEKWVKEKRDMVWLAMNAYFPTWRKDLTQRERVYAMEFLRYGIGKLDKKDNLRAAFKPVLDAVASFLIWGDEAPAHIRAIGTADDKLERRGVDWTYRQMQCPANPRAYGIQIILHCVPLSTPQSEPSS